MQFANSVFEYKWHWLVNECVYNACNSEYATNNCAYVSQELKYVLFLLIELHCDRGKLIVEKEQVLIRVEVVLVEGC